MTLLINALIGIIVALIVYFVGTAVLHFSHAHLILGLIALVILLLIAFGRPTSRWGGPAA